MNNTDIYPLAIVKDRYNGTYSGGIYIAFNCFPNEIPEEIFDSDDEAFDFWFNKAADFPHMYGLGRTIDGAIANLTERLSNIEKD